MRKLIIVVAIGMLICTGCSGKNNSEADITTTTVQSNPYALAGNQITQITSSEEFKNADAQKRIELVEPLLKELVESGALTSYEVYEDSSAIGIVYPDGTKGMIALEDADLSEYSY